jgi:large subunit ribosomal protein L25
MKKVSLSGSPRANVGKKDAADLRNKGLVPCVVYGVSGQTAFSVEENPLKKIVWNPAVFQIELNIGGKVINTIMQDIQFHPVTDRVVHVDFLELVPNKPVKVKLPVRLVGSSEGVKKGGKMIQNFRKIAVVGTPETLPDAIEVNVEKLDLGQMIRIREVKIDGIKFTESPDSVIAAVKTTRNVATETPAATGKK